METIRGSEEALHSSALVSRVRNNPG